jgi:hypothetical protein
MHEIRNTPGPDELSSVRSSTPTAPMPLLDDYQPIRSIPPTRPSLHTPDDGLVNGAVTEFVRDYMNAREIEVLFDGTLFLRGQPMQAVTPNEIDAILAVDPPTVSDLLDEIALHARHVGSPLRRGDLAAALRQVLRSEKHQRYQAVLRPLFDTCSSSEAAQADAQWRRLAGLFDMNPELAIAILQHFVWSVKQKQLRRPVVHHCMPIIFSTTQGTGKTVFVKKFLAPLRELATDTALFTDLADRRSGDIFRFPVILLDDMERTTLAMVPALKSVLTSDRLRRRRMGTSASDAIRQACVPIGTSNQMIHELVEDDTGHRRFAMLPFRNGATFKGGDASVWETVNAVDYELLWRSVDAFASSPVLPFREELFRHEHAEAKPTGVIGWVTDLDLESEAVRNITTRHGVRAQGLRDLFMTQTGVEISAQKFAKDMERCCMRPEMPFSDKIKIETGAVYRRKSRLSPAGAVQSGSGRREWPVLAVSAPPASSSSSSSSVPPATSVGEGASLEPQP